MNEPPIDLSPLDPTRDASRFDLALADIHRDALAARHAVGRRSDFGASIAALWLPASVAAAVVFVISISTLVRLAKDPAPATRVASTPEVLGIPPRLAALMRTPPSTVSLAALNDALGGGQ